MPFLEDDEDIINTIMAERAKLGRAQAIQKGWYFDAYARATCDHCNEPAAGGCPECVTCFCAKCSKLHEEC